MRILPRLTTILFISVCSALAIADSTPPDLEQKIDSIVSRMTLPEKLGQMSQRGFPDKLTDNIKAEIRAVIFEGSCPLKFGIGSALDTNCRIRCELRLLFKILPHGNQQAPR
jgi:hypothetical protein